MARMRLSFRNGGRPSADNRRCWPARLGACGAAVLASLALFPAAASAACPTFHALANGTTADATAVMDNFNYILGCPNFTGNVGINVASPGAMLDISAASGIGLRVATVGSYGVRASITGGGSSYYGGYFSSGSYYGGLGRSDGWTIVGNGSAWITGSVYTTAVYTASDSRLKDNIAPLSGALDTIRKLQPVTFTWKTTTDEYARDKSKQVGLIAQDLQKVLPQLVALTQRPASSDGPPSLDSQLGQTYGVDYTKLIPVLIGALQEQAAQIDDLKQRVATLEHK